MPDNSVNTKNTLLTGVLLPEAPSNNTPARCPLRFFILGLSPFIILCVIGLLAAALIWWSGLGSTGLDNYFGFGLWTVFEFILIAFGAGAFFTGLLRYILDIEPIKEVFNLSLVIAFICYTGGIFIAVLQTGQPLRAWFLFRYANLQSMLTLAGFSLFLYALILAVQYSSILLKHRSLAGIPLFNHLGKNLRLFMPLFAALGAFVAVFHQGAPGGMFGVLDGRPFAFREGFFIWPWTFFLFILSVLGAGLMFTVMVGSGMEKLSRKQLLDPGVKNMLGRIAGNMLCIYIIFKMLDTLWWAKGMIPQAGLGFEQMFHSPYYSFWLLILEVGLCGVIPVILLLCKSTRKKPFLFHLAGFLTCLGLCINRYTLVIQTQAQPVMPFDSWRLYIPGLPEWAVAGMIISYGVIILSLSYRYLPVFTQEKQFKYP
jgi:molybdopterin-containing oxidoreductase family membrane subunit